MSQLKQYSIRVAESFHINIQAESEEEAKEIIAKEIPKHKHAGINENYQRRHHFGVTHFVTPSGKLSRREPDYLQRCLETWRNHLNRAQCNLDRAQCLDAPKHIIRKYEDDVEYYWEKVCDSKKELEAWECE